MFGNLWTKVKGWFGGNAQPLWQPIWGNRWGPGTYDAFKSRAEPDKLALLQAYDDITFACVNLIARNIARIPLKLCVETRPGQATPKCRIIGLKRWEKRRLWGLKNAYQVDEVIEHPLLSLVYNPNPEDSYSDLLGQTQIYLDTTGNAYWFLVRNGFGVPEEIWLLPSHMITPIRQANGIGIEAYYFGLGKDQKRYEKDQLIHFKSWNPLDPYGEGYSPLRSVYQRVMLGWKELSYLESTLTNNARPDAIISPTGDGFIADPERYAKEFAARFKASGAGGLFVSSDPVMITPVGWPPKDLAALEMYKHIKTAICNAFGIPPDIWEIGQANKASAVSVLYTLAIHCIKPRIEHLLETVNKHLASQFDSRLFFAATAVMPEDEEFDLREAQAMVASGAMTRAEWRERVGLPAADWADEPLLPAGVMPADAFTLPALPGLDQAEGQEPATVPDTDQAEAEPATPEQSEAAASNDLRATVGGSVAIADLQRSYYRGELPREAAISNAVLIFGFSDEEAARLFPEIAPDAPKAETSPAAPAGPVDQAEADQLGKACCPHHKAIDLPDVRQQQDYDCGTACVAAVLAAFGMAVDYAELGQKLGTDEANGTDPTAIVGYLTGLGLDVSARHGMELGQLAEAVEAGRPVICPIQRGGTDQAEAYERSGHYVVVTGFTDPETVKAHDPVTGPCEIPAADFLGRWQDKGADGTEYYRFGVAVGVGQQTATDASRKASGMTGRTQGQPPPPKPLAAALRTLFRKQRVAVLASLKAFTLDNVTSKASPPDRFVNLEDWSEDMAKELSPVVQLYADHGAQQTVARVGGSPDLIKTVHPKLKEGVANLTLSFCEETNATTSLLLSEALAKLKEELEAGLIEGDSRNAMMRRVQQVFDRAENERAFQIAITESSRAIHAANVITAKESGVVTGKRWLLSDDACPLCKPLANKVVGLDENFLVDGTGPYAEIPYPPRHPQCRCTLLEVTD